jgi:hypothetical protein
MIISKLLLFGNTKCLNQLGNVTPIVQNGILLYATRLDIEGPLSVPTTRYRITCGITCVKLFYPYI